MKLAKRIDLKSSYHRKKSVTMRQVNCEEG